MWRWLERRAGIEPGDRRRFRSLLSIHFALICAFTLAKAARDGLYLSQHPAEHLPFLYIGLAAAGFLAASAVGGLTRRSAAHIALGWELGVSAFAFLFCFAATHAWPAATGYVFYLWTGVYGVLLVARFWSLAGAQFTPRQARRIFGLLSASGILGGLAGGALAVACRWFWLPVEYLLLPAAGLHLAAMPLFPTLAPRSAASPRPAPEPRRASGLRPDRRPYLIRLAALFLIAGMTSAVIDYQLKVGIQTEGGYGSATEIGEFMGKLYVVQNALALVLQLGIAGMLFTRLHPRQISVLFPAAVLALSLGEALLPGFGLPIFDLVIALRVLDATARFSVAGTAWEFLYFPLDDAESRSARRFLSAVVVRGAEAVAGLLLLLMGLLQPGTLENLSGLLIALSALWLLLELRTSVAYRRQLATSVGRPVATEWIARSAVAGRGSLRGISRLVDLAGEIQDLLGRVRTLSVLPDARARNLLRHALLQRTHQSFQALHDALAAAQPSPLLKTAWQGLLADDARTRERSLELLQSELAAEQRRIVFPLVDELVAARAARPGPENRAKLSLDCADLLESLALQREDPWISACSLFAIGSLRITSLQRLAGDGTDAEPVLLRDARRWVAERFAGAEPAGADDDLHRRLLGGSDLSRPSAPAG